MSHLTKARLLAASSLLFCVSCGSDPESSEKTTLEMYSWWTAPGEADALDALLGEHERKHSSVDVVNVSVSAGSDNAARLLELQTRMRNGAPPDTFQEVAHHIQDRWVDGGYALEPLNNLFEDEGWNSVFHPEVLKSFTFDSEILALPVNVHRENAFFYSPKLFTQYGITVPTTFVSLQHACIALKSNVAIAPIAVSSQGWIVRMLLVAVTAMSLGGEKFATLTAGTSDSSAAGFWTDFDAALDNFAWLFDNGCVRVYSAANATDKSADWDQVANHLVSDPPSAAMFAHGDWVKGLFAVGRKTPGRDYAVFTAGDRLFLYGADSFVVPANAPHKAEALDLLRSWGSAQGQKAFNLIKGSSPVRTDVDLSSDPVAAQVLEDLQNATYVTGTPAWLTSEALQNLLSEYALRTADIEEVRQLLHSTYPQATP